MFVFFRILDCVQSAESSIPSCDVPLLEPFQYYFFVCLFVCLFQVAGHVECLVNVSLWFLALLGDLVCCVATFIGLGVQFLKF
jgi:hypothetical protein